MATRRKKRAKKKSGECRLVQISKSGARKSITRGSKAQCNAAKRTLEKKNKGAAYIIEDC